MPCCSERRATAKPPERIAFEGGELRRLTDADLAALIELARANAQHLRPYMALGRDGFEEAFARTHFLSKIASWGSDAEFAYGVWLPSTGSGVLRQAQHDILIGVVSLHGLMFDSRQPELSYWIDKGHEGRGIVTRAVRALIDASAGPLGVQAFVITCRTENLRSRAVAERLGFQPAGVQRRMLVTGVSFEEVRYELPVL